MLEFEEPKYRLRHRFPSRSAYRRHLKNARQRARMEDPEALESSVPLVGGSEIRPPVGWGRQVVIEDPPVITGYAPGAGISSRLPADRIPPPIAGGENVIETRKLDDDDDDKAVIVRRRGLGDRFRDWWGRRSWFYPSGRVSRSDVIETVREERDTYRGRRWAGATLIAIGAVVAGVALIRACQNQPGEEATPEVVSTATPLPRAGVFVPTRTPLPVGVEMAPSVVVIQPPAKPEQPTPVPAPTLEPTAGRGTAVPTATPVPDRPRLTYPEGNFARDAGFGLDDLRFAQVNGGNLKVSSFAGMIDYEILSFRKDQFGIREAIDPWNGHHRQRLDRYMAEEPERYAEDFKAFFYGMYVKTEEKNPADNPIKEIEIGGRKVWVVNHPPLGSSINLMRPRDNNDRMVIRGLYDEAKKQGLVS